MTALTHNPSKMTLKTVIITVLVLLSSSTCMAQYNQYNSFMRKALVIYKCGPDGYYRATRDVTLNEVKDVGTQTPTTRRRRTCMCSHPTATVR